MFLWRPAGEERTWPSRAHYVCNKHSPTAEPGARWVQWVKHLSIILTQNNTYIYNNSHKWLFLEKTTESIFPVWLDLQKKKYCDNFMSFYFSAFNVNLDTVYVISLPEPNPQVSLSDHVYLVFCWCHCRWYCLNCFGQSVLYLQFHILLIH